MTTGHCESSLGSFDELQNSAQAAVDPETKPPDLGCESVKAWKSVLSCSVVYRAVKGLVTMIDDSSH